MTPSQDMSLDDKRVQNHMKAGKGEEDLPSKHPLSSFYSSRFGHEGQSLNEIKQLISLPRRQYDEFDISEALVLDDGEKQTLQSDSSRPSNYYSTYINNAVSFLNQEDKRRSHEFGLFQPSQQDHQGNQHQ